MLPSVFSWDDYRFFLAVYRATTLKAAAASLGVDQATVGRRIAALQDAMGARILESVEAAEAAMLSIDRRIAGEDDRVEGIVKVAMPGALANQLFITSLRPLLKQYPKLELQFLTGPEVLNLSRREADFAIRLVRSGQKDLKARKLGFLRLGLYAAKELEMPAEKAPFVGLYESAMSEAEKAFLKTLRLDGSCALRSAAWTSVAIAVQAGLGVGVLPTFFGEKNKALRLVQEDRVETPIWLVVHPEVAESARVRAVIDYFSKILLKQG